MELRITLLLSCGVMALGEYDCEFFERELASFVPDRVFDAHCHIWPANVDLFPEAGLTGGIDHNRYRQLLDDLHPGRQTVGAMFLSFGRPANPSECDLVNEWVGRQAAADPGNRGLFFVRPDDDPQWVHAQVQRLGLHGLKCYHTFSAVKPTWEAEIPDYLPESLVQMAHEQGWVITLHMVRSRGVADPSNIHWIRHYCKTYPAMKLVLAHAARGFQPAHNLEGLEDLVGLDNLYFDTSVNCEPIAHQVILRRFGHRRLMYGTDLPISHLRGRHVCAADRFLWLYENSPVWSENSGDVRPVLIGLEHLRALKWTCWSERLSDSEVEDIFCNNAARLLGVTD